MAKNAVNSMEDKVSIVNVGPEEIVVESSVQISNPVIAADTQSIDASDNLRADAPQVKEET